MKGNTLAVLFLISITLAAPIAAYAAVAPKCDRVSGGYLNGVNCECIENGNCTLKDMVIVVQNIMQWVFGISAAIALLFFVVGGATLLISQGNEQTIARGKTMIRGATIGLIIIFLSWLIVNTIVFALTGSTAIFGKPWNQIISSQSVRIKKVKQTETTVQDYLSFTGSFNDIRGLNQNEFDALAQQYGIDTSSGLYSFYRNDIYQISQDIVNGNINSSQKLYDALPLTVKIFTTHNQIEELWNMILKYQ